MNQKTHKQNVEKCRDIIAAKLGSIKPKIAIILGSGLGDIAKEIKKPVIIKYADLPGFPELKVAGHVGEVISGSLNGVDILAFKGRKHFYETDDAYPLKTMIRTIKALGIDSLFLSNAAGSVRKHIRTSELMLITDHINFMGYNPLVGENDDDFGVRFPAMNDAWDKELGAKLHASAREQHITMHEGVYMAFRGPNFETAAEIKMAQVIGADAVGMSSVPDCLIARHCGLKVVGCSCITNMAEGLSDEQLSHEHTLANAKIGAENFRKLLMEFIGRL